MEWAWDWWDVVPLPEDGAEFGVPSDGDDSDESGLHAEGDESDSESTKSDDLMDDADVARVHVAEDHAEAIGCQASDR